MLVFVSSTHLYIGSQKKKVAQQEAEDVKNAGPGSSASGIPKELLHALYEKVKNDPLPPSLEERHAYFTQIVTLAERLSTMGEYIFYLG